MEIFFEGGTWIALLTLTFLEIVLGIDNLIFISLVCNQLPKEKQQRTRFIGLGFALLTRIIMLLGITWIIGFDSELFSVYGVSISGKKIILALGGLFLIAKSTSEIHGKLDTGKVKVSVKASKAMARVIMQIVVLDIVFSFDSILTAIGMTKVLVLMIIAIIIAMIVMLLFSKAIGDFVDKHPTLQILALAFLILIGFMLVLEAADIHVPKAYIYFAVFFSLLVEMINIRQRKKSEPMKLHQRSEDGPSFDR